MNLKLWFLIKSGYYIVPSPSTALALGMYGVLGASFFSPSRIYSFSTPQTLNLEFSFPKPSKYII